MANVLGPKWK